MEKVNLAEKLSRFSEHWSPLDIHFRDRVVRLEEGECLIVPRGVEHRPVAEREAHVLLFEPASTLNTGEVRSDLTVDAPERL